MPATRLHLRLTQTLFIIASVLVVGGIFLGAAWVADHRLVAALFGQDGATNVAVEHATVPARLPSADLAVYRAFAATALQDDAPLVLAYHDIQLHPKSAYAITPHRFEEQMSMLAEAGFRTATAGQLNAYLRGAPLPRRSVVITFDDGTSGLWRYGDRILQRHGFHGVSFVITGDVTSQAASYYLTWEELRRMHASGRWDVESHSDKGHGLVPTGATGTRGPFFVTKEWRPALRRFETAAEYRNRISSDLESSKQKIKAAGLPTPVFFAHPFSPRARDANDPTNLSVLGDVVHHEFSADFINDDFAKQLRGAPNGAPLPRLEVVGAETARALFESIHRTMGLPVTDLQPFTTPELWVDDQGRPLASGFAGDQLVLPISLGTFARAHYAPGASSQWSSYELGLRVEGLGAAGAGGSAGVAVHEGNDGSFHVTISAARLSVRRGLEPNAPVLYEARLFPSSAHDVAVAVAGPFVTVVVDGRVMFRGVVPLAPGAGVPMGGFSLNASRPSAGAAEPIFYALRVAPL